MAEENWDGIDVCVGVQRRQHDVPLLSIICGVIHSHRNNFESVSLNWCAPSPISVSPEKILILFNVSLSHKKSAPIPRGERENPQKLFGAVWSFRPGRIYIKPDCTHFLSRVGYGWEITSPLLGGIEKMPNYISRRRVLSGGFRSGADLPRI